MSDKYGHSWYAGQLVCPNPMQSAKATQVIKDFALGSDLELEVLEASIKAEASRRNLPISIMLSMLIALAFVTSLLGVLTWLR